MLIIVEGVDGVGKTTLCDKLYDRIQKDKLGDTLVWHAGPPLAPTGLEEYELPLQEYRPGEERHIICDRWHIGELIYGPLLRRECRLPSSQRTHLEMFLQAKGALMVHLTNSPDQVRDRRKNRGGQPDLLEDDHIEKVINWYFDETFDSMIDTQEMIIGDDGIHDGHLTYLIALAQMHEADAHVVRDIPTYVGPRRPDLLLLGERRNQKSDDRWSGAFVPLVGSSGEYLLRNLTEDVRYTCGIANAAEVVNLRSTWESLDCPAVVTLGTVADKICHEVRINHGSVPHPQWVRRFAHHHGTEYGNLIRRAAKFEEDLLSWRP